MSIIITMISHHYDFPERNHVFDTHVVKICIVLLRIYVKPFSSVSDRLRLNKTEHIYVVNSFGETVHLRHRHFSHI